MYPQENKSDNKQVKPIATYLPNLIFTTAIFLGALGLVLSIMMILTGNNKFGMYVGLALFPFTAITSCILFAIGLNIRYSQELILTQRTAARVLSELPENIHHTICESMTEVKTLLNTQDDSSNASDEISNMLMQMSTQLDTLHQNHAKIYSQPLLNQTADSSENICIDTSEDISPMQEDSLASNNLIIDQQIDSRIQHINDLMSIADFNSAMQAMNELQSEFPTSQKVQLMHERISNEAETFHAQQRKRFLELISEHGQARNWSSSLEVAHKLIEKYPGTVEAQEAQSILPTIIDNARIQEVRAYRNRFVEMMQRKCYPQALELAQYVTENYPETAAAEELRSQLPQIWELARRSQTGQV